MNSPVLRCHHTSGSMTLRAVMAKSPRKRTARNVCFVVRVEVMMSWRDGGFIRGGSAEEHDGQHWQIEKDHSDATHLSEVVGGVVPAPNTGAPTHQNCGGK